MGENISELTERDYTSHLEILNDQGKPQQDIGTEDDCNQYKHDRNYYSVERARQPAGVFEILAYQNDIEGLLEGLSPFVYLTFGKEP